jgi:hypothetical protein
LVGPAFWIALDARWRVEFLKSGLPVASALENALAQGWQLREGAEAASAEFGLTFLSQN